MLESVAGSELSREQAQRSTPPPTKMQGTALESTKDAEQPYTSSPHSSDSLVLSVTEDGAEVEAMEKPLELVMDCGMVAPEPLVQPSGVSKGVMRMYSDA